MTGDIVFVLPVCRTAKQLSALRFEQQQTAERNFRKLFSAERKQTHFGRLSALTRTDFSYVRPDDVTATACTIQRAGRYNIVPHRKRGDTVADRASTASRRSFN